jgi:hypothetical protein
MGSGILFPQARAKTVGKAQVGRTWVGRMSKHGYDEWKLAYPPAWDDEDDEEEPESVPDEDES